MNSSEHKCRTWNIKKDQRLEAKKRKLEALLNLVGKDDLNNLKKKKKESLEENYKELKSQLKKYATKPKAEPSFHLTELGSKSLIELKPRRVNKHSNHTIFPLFIEDIYHLLLRSLLGHLSPYSVNWCKLNEPQNISKTLLLVVEGLTRASLIENISQLNNITDTFPFAFEIASSNMPFATELSTQHLLSGASTCAKKVYSMFPTEENDRKNLEKNTKNLSKLHLLLSPIQLVMEHYPLPNTVFERSKCANYFFTKSLYSPVTVNSPLFAIDCEMCQTVSRKNEVTRIAIVNEDLEVVYTSFVKPKQKIIDYMTKYSGVTREMLDGVKTTLNDVQREIQKILPSDAILCGQSLNCDLHALNMIHPYVIDTSVIFNGSGTRRKKDSLRHLALVHLNETIQDKKSGHNPIEDSIATMKLVKLKLGNNIQYGDAVLDESISNEKSKSEEVCMPGGDAKMENGEHENFKYSDDGFFSKMLKFSKNICLIGSEETLENYENEDLKNVTKISKSSNKKIVKATNKNMENFDLTISHVTFDNEEIHNSLQDLDSMAKELFDSCPDKSLFMIIASGNDGTKLEAVRNGICLIVLKKLKAVQ